MKRRITTDCAFSICFRYVKRMFPLFRAIVYKCILRISRICNMYQPVNHAAYHRRYNVIADILHFTQSCIYTSYASYPWICDSKSLLMSFLSIQTFSHTNVCKYCFRYCPPQAESQFKQALKASETWVRQKNSPSSNDEAVQSKNYSLDLIAVHLSCFPPCFSS